MSSTDAPAELLSRIRTAAIATARVYPDPHPPRPEDHLERVFHAGLVDAGVAAESIGARRRYVDTDWSPRPGAIDLYVRHAGSDELQVALELKVEKVDETLWDALKMLAAVASEQAAPIHVAGLVVVASSRKWRTSACRELFEPPEGTTTVIDTTSLIVDNAGAWRWLLLNGRARPTHAPARFAITTIARAQVGERDRSELRAIQVSLCDEERIAFTPFGWPVGGGIDIDCSGPASTKPSGGETVDCAGYQIPKRFGGRAATDAWLGENVPEMSDVQIEGLLHALRSRGWTQFELDERVLVHAAPPPASAVP